MSEIGSRDQRRTREYRVMMELSEEERVLVSSCDFKAGSILAPIVAALGLMEEDRPEAVAQRPHLIEAAERNQVRIRTHLAQLETALPRLTASQKPELLTFHALMQRSLDLFQKIVRVNDLAIEFIKNHHTAIFGTEAPELGRINTYSVELERLYQQLYALMKEIDPHPAYQTVRAQRPEADRNDHTNTYENSGSGK